MYRPLEQIMPDGIPFGPLSESSRRKLYDRLKDKWMHFFAAPPQATFAGKDTDSRYLYALYSLRDENLMCIESTFSSFILDFCRFIEKNWDVLVRDIDAGTISEDVQMPDDVRKILTEDLSPMPERAAKLRKIFENGFNRPFMPLVWPDLLYISAAASGGFSRYTREIRSRYLGEKILFYYRGIVASEGIFSVPTAPADFSSCLIPDALFYEFLAVEEEDEEEPENKRNSGADKAAPLTMDQLKPGRKYELIITDHSGFYRYRMKDVVLVTGTHNAAPMVEFQYRTDKTVSLMGEKTTEAALRFAEEETAKECGFLLVDSSVYPDTEEIIRYFVAHNFVLNYDSYIGTMLHNYYLYENDGRLAMLPWDYNEGFGAFSRGAGQSTSTTLVNTGIDTPLSGATEADRPMWNWIVSNDEYLEQYHEIFSELISTYFESGKYAEDIDAVYDMIQPYVEKDPTALCTGDQFRTAVSTLKSFCELRSESIRAQLDGTLATATTAQTSESQIDASNISLNDMSTKSGGSGHMPGAIGGGTP